jgi:excisionase family DNA binding protein
MVLSVKEIAALLGCSEQAVYRKVYRRALSYRKMGRKVIFLRQEVEAYLHE